MVQAQLIDRDVTGPAVLVRRAVVALVLLGLVACLLVAYGRGMFFDRVEVSAVVDDAGGALTVGSDVKSRGVILGEVTSIDADDDGVRIGMSLDGDQARRLPGSVHARVIAATVFGTTAVDLVVPPGTDTSEHLQAGQVISQDRSARTLELQDTLDSTDRVLRAVEPAKLATTLSSVAGALKGRGERLGESLETLETYLGRLQPHLPLLQEDLRLAGIYLRTLADVSPDLLTATDDALVTARTVTAKQQQLADTLTRSRRLVDTADQFLREQREQIVRGITNSAITFDALFDHRAGLADGFRAFIRFAELGTKGFSDGPFLQTDVFIKTGGDRPYTAEDCPRFGSALGDNCPGASPASRSGSAGSGDDAAEPDAGLIDRIAGLLASLGGAQ